MICCLFICATLTRMVMIVNFAEKYNFLGISIVGQSNDKGDGGIYIGSIMKGLVVTVVWCFEKRFSHEKT